MKIRAQVEVTVKPFAVPNYVLAEAPIQAEGSEGSTSFPLSALDADTLDRMCDEFREAVFKKAGKSQPARCDAEA